MQAWLEVDLGAVARNVERVKEKVGRTVGVIAVVKSNAYGFGIEKIVSLLNRRDVEMFAVISMDEARQVRQYSTKPILILGYLDTKEVTDAVAEGFRVSLYDHEQLAQYQRIAERMGKSLPVHVKVETGLNRLGMSHEQVVDFLAAQRRFPNLKVEALYSHLIKADDRESNMEQLRKIQDLVIDLQGKVPLLPIHLASSYALSNFSEGYFDAVRVGLALYGIDEVLPDLESALTCKAVVAQVKPVKAGQGVSYGPLYTAQTDSTVAAISIGYADGLSQIMRGHLTVLIRGQEVPIIGQICMNMIIADVSKIHEVKRGDEVVVLGSQKDERGNVATISVTTLAARCAIRHHEIITRLGAALPKRYFGVTG